MTTSLQRFCKIILFSKIIVKSIRILSDENPDAMCQIRPNEKLFVSCNGPKNDRVMVCRSVKIFCFHYIFAQECVFHACFMLIGSWEGGKNFGVGIFLNKNMLG